MASGFRVYVERGSKRVFAGAVEWPGLDRGGRDEAAAIQVLVIAAPRYAAALGDVAGKVDPPTSVDEVHVEERIAGDASTDFGIPAIGPGADQAPLAGSDLERLAAILDAAWRAFDAAAWRGRGKELRKGPRGGGRDLEKIVEHVLGAEQAYLRMIGGRKGAASHDPGRAMRDVRNAAREALRALAAGTPTETDGRRTRKLWAPRYFVRRSAWHALDHAWEIEDRST